jgi:hypothetical protein
MTETTLVHTVIAAQPGWSLAIFIEAGKEPQAGGKEWEAGFAHEPIIAWEIKITSEPYIQSRDGRS